MMRLLLIDLFVVVPIQSARSQVAATQYHTLVPAADIAAGLSALLAGLRQAINNMPGRAADKMLHITDHHEAEEILQQEMKVLLKTIAACAFFDSIEKPKRAIVKAHPRRENKLEFKQEAYPPLDGASCSVCLLVKVT